MKKENTEGEKLIERSTYALGKGASAVFFLLPGRGSAAVRRKRLFSFSVPGIRGMPRQSRRAFWEGEEGGAARPFARLCSVGARAGRGSGTGSEPLKNEMDILHMGEAGLWAVPPVMTKARLRAKAHACGEGGPTEPDGTGPQLRRGEGGDPHRSDERQAYSGASATHRTRRGGLRGDFRTRGGSFFLFLCRAFSAGGGFRSLRRRRPSMAGRFALEGISRAAPEARSLLPPGDREGAARAQRLCVFGKEAPPAALWCRASRGMKKAPRNTSAGPCMTEGGGRGKAL